MELLSHHSAEIELMLSIAVRFHDFWFYQGDSCYCVTHSVQDIEATIHCAEWLSIVGGSSIGEQRVR